MSQATTAIWKKSHPRNVQASNRRYRKNHPERVLLQSSQWRKKNFEAALLCYARVRARRRGQPFAITTADIHVPEFCPALGIRLQREGRDGRKAEDFPTLDCLIPSLGYVPGKVFVISMRANRIKYNASWQELKKIADWVYQESEHAAR